jgi:hypothetical protein
MGRVLRTYTYKGQVLAEKISYGRHDARVEPVVSEGEISMIAANLDSYDKIHMKKHMNSVFTTLTAHGIDPAEYVDDDTLRIYIAEKGVESMTQLREKDRTAWTLIKDRGLAKDIFGRLENKF